MNTEKGHALFPILKQLSSRKKLGLRPYKSAEAERRPLLMFVAAARNTVRWTIQHDQDAVHAIRKGKACGNAIFLNIFRRYLEYIALASSSRVSSDPQYRRQHSYSLALDCKYWKSQLVGSRNNFSRLLV
jgi:hypothetical protein